MVIAMVTVIVMVILIVIVLVIPGESKKRPVFERLLLHECISNDIAISDQIANMFNYC